MVTPRSIFFMSLGPKMEFALLVHDLVTFCVSGLKQSEGLKLQFQV